MSDADDHSSSTSGDAIAVVRLAALPALECDRVRRDEAVRLGVRPETLDRQVLEARRVSSPRGNGEDRLPRFCDDALALRFSARHADHLRYVAVWGRWLLREAGGWRFDETVKIFDLARAADPPDAAHHVLNDVGAG